MRYPSKLRRFLVPCENRPIRCRLAEQIYNRIRVLTGFDIGTLCALFSESRLDRGNMQWPRVLGLFSKPKKSLSNFLVDLKVQPTTPEKNCAVREVYKIFEVKKWMNMNSKPDKKM
jgi:hypothetical protein